MSRALLFLVLTRPAWAGQIEAPVSVEVAPGAQAGSIGSVLGAPAPVQLTVPSLTGSAAPSLAAALAPAPSPRPAALQAAALQPAAAKPVPVLPASAVAPAKAAVKPAAAAAGAGSAASAPDGRADAGRAFFDQGGAVEPLRSVVRRGQTRGEGWEVDGRPAERLSGGGFKEVLIHPSDPRLVIKLFSGAGARDEAGSMAEKRLEMKNLSPLLRIGRTPRVVEQGGLEMKTPSVKSGRTTGYIVQERVVGRELGDLLSDPDPSVRARALEQARALFDELVAARIKLEDRVKMHENISVGRAGGRPGTKAWVLDAGEATVVAERGLMDRMLGRPDPLRAYYDAVLADLVRLSRR